MFPSDRIVLQAPVAKSTRTSLPPSLTMARSFAGGNAEGMRSHRGQARQARQSAAAHVGADQLIATVHLRAEHQLLVTLNWITAVCPGLTLKTLRRPFPRLVVV